MLALAICLLVAAPSAAQSKKPAPPAYVAGETAQIEELKLTLSFPAAFEQLERQAADAEDDELGKWTAKLGGKDVYIDVEAWPRFAAGEPSGITWRMRDFVSDEEWTGPVFEFASHELVAGPFGHAPYASLLWGSLVQRGTTKDIGSFWMLAGVTETSAYLLSIEIEPVANAEEKQVVLDFCTKGVSCSGPVRDAKWKEDEVVERWEKDSAFTEKKHLRDLKVIRTAHYLVMTNSSGGNQFAKQMEINYGIIQKTYPFAEVPGRKLMPVFLFQNPQEYYDFCVKQFEWTQEEARESKGVASGDFYATWYEAPQDPVHIHEATHQIFANRLELDGGGSWFQEGVAEYIETKPNERNDIARRVKDGKHTPLRELMKLRSLLMSSEDDKSGDSAASLHYKEAALLIEFLRESKFGKDKFLEWLHAMGNAPRRDLAKIEAIFKRIYGVSIDELDEEFVRYCKKR